MFGWLKARNRRQQFAQDVRTLAAYIDNPKNNYIGDYSGILWDIADAIGRNQSIDIQRTLESWRFKLPTTVLRPGRALTAIKGGKDD